LAYNLIYFNTAVIKGAGVMSEYCSPVLMNNTIANNRCTYISVNSYGAGITAYGNASFSGVNNIIYWNSADSSADYAGSLTLTYSCSTPLLAGAGNIDSNPMFVDTSTADFNLQAVSPCIDGGDPRSALDPDGTNADMGALYFDQSVGIPDLPDNVPSAYQLISAYPNPFNPATTFNYELKVASTVLLKIYDIQGREIGTLIDGYREAGNHQVVFDGSGLTSGVYFYRFEAGDFMATRKMVLLK